MPVILLGYVFSAMYAVVTAGLYIEKKTGVLPWIAGAGAAINIAICVVAAAALDGGGGVGHARGLRADGGAGRVAEQPRVPGPLRVGAAGAPGRYRGRHLGGRLVAGGHGWSPTAGSTVGVKFALLLAFPLLLVATRFLRAGEWDALRQLLRRGR